MVAPKIAPEHEICHSPDGQPSFFCVDKNDPHRGTGGYTN
jgi:hypothetical protein